MNHDLQEAWLAAPDEILPAAIYADWLEEQGDVRAQWLREYLERNRAIAALPENIPFYGRTSTIARYGVQAQNRRVFFGHPRNAQWITINLRWSPLEVSIAPGHARLFEILTPALRRQVVRQELLDCRLLEGVTAWPLLDLHRDDYRLQLPSAGTISGMAAETDADFLAAIRQIWSGDNPVAGTVTAANLREARQAMRHAGQATSTDAPRLLPDGIPSLRDAITASGNGFTGVLRSILLRSLPIPDINDGYLPEAQAQAAQNAYFYYWRQILNWQWAALRKFLPVLQRTDGDRETRGRYYRLRDHV